MEQSEHELQESQIRRKISIPIQQRAVYIGDLIIVNGHRAARSSLMRRFQEGGYQIRATPHFLLCTRAATPSLILIHLLAPDDLSADLPHTVVQELAPFGLPHNSDELGAILTGILAGSLYPDEVRRAWNTLGANTLQRLLLFLTSGGLYPLPDYGTLTTFACLYQRVCELAVGECFLDAGCNQGFLPLLLAERLPFVKEAVGLDRNAAAFAVGRELAHTRQLAAVRFVEADLRQDLRWLGTFDTVTILHVLEHFTAAETQVVLRHLLAITRLRLLVAVPYESDPPTAAYGHQQCFSRTSLEGLGAWCLQQLRGAARLWCEDCARGGLLLVERAPDSSAREESLPAPYSD
jgi:SAM-dependent methyltransferase